MIGKAVLIEGSGHALKWTGGIVTETLLTGCRLFKGSPEIFLQFFLRDIFLTFPNGEEGLLSQDHGW